MTSCIINMVVNIVNKNLVIIVIILHSDVYIYATPYPYTYP